ncbi:hypothetical protein ABW19_dt0200883 [Dactylella cylindrospora]|nr:hypothetical protein ABW19_dt0200883 [Dactylella cylindrospora]
MNRRIGTTSTSTPQDTPIIGSGNSSSAATREARSRLLVLFVTWWFPKSGYDNIYQPLRAVRLFAVSIRKTTKHLLFLLSDASADLDPVPNIHSGVPAKHNLPLPRPPGVKSFKSLNKDISPVTRQYRFKSAVE